MAAAILYILSKLRLGAPKSTCNSRLIHSQDGIGAPSIAHLVIDDESLAKYKEIIVIGDVHGCYDELEELLVKADVKTQDVLKILVGDLVNKGPKNEEVLKLVRTMPSILSVRGNHDEVVLRVYNKSQDHKNSVPEKNLWMTKLSVDDISYLSQLPYTIQLLSLNTVIVHAGIVPGIPIECNNPHDLVSMRNITIKDYFFEGGVQATNSDKIGYPWAEMWKGPQHIYFGHDAKRLLQKKPFATGLDTGCVYGRKLTGVFIYGPRKGTYVDVQAHAVYEKPKG